MSGPAAIPPGAVTADDIAGFAEIILFELSDTGGTGQGARTAAIRAAERIIEAAEAVWPHASATDSTPVPAPRPGCCEEDGCRRTNPIGIYRGDFTGQVYAATSMRVERDHGDGTATFAATARHDITRQMVRFLKANAEWAREVLAGAE